MIFVSHANPEDNRIALWLATKLAAEGFPVWCDLIDLIGGETFWGDIEDAIKNHAEKVIVLLSTSSGKPGVKDEINCAIQRERRENLKDFVIPCRVDDVAFDSNIQIARKNIIDCHGLGWAETLRRVLAKLEKDGVAKDPKVNPSLINSAWSALFPAGSGVTDDPELYDTNRIAIKTLPKTLWANDAGAPGADDFFPVTASVFEGRRLSFQARNPRASLFGRDPEFMQPMNIELDDFIQGGWDELGVDSRRARHVVVELLSKSWSRYLRGRNLEPYDLSGFRSIFYFHKENLPAGEVITQLPERPARPRSLWGEHTVPRSARRESRFYHLAWEGRVDDDNGWHLMLLPHIVWTSDALRATYEKDEQHRLRRRQCKGWWNDRWRGFLYATLTWAAEGKETIEIPVGDRQTMTLANAPSRLLSPVTHARVQGVLEDDGENADE
ncbi:MAG: toll/interleukin-1 receptor domain-containing protein [Fimbriimonadaceae bacterium]